MATHTATKYIGDQCDLVVVRRAHGIEGLTPAEFWEASIVSVGLPVSHGAVHPLSALFGLYQKLHRLRDRARSGCNRKLAHLTEEYAMKETVIALESQWLKVVTAAHDRLVAEQIQHSLGDLKEADATATAREE